MTRMCPYTCYRKKKPQPPQTKLKKNDTKLVFFDMDGVLTNILSSWKHIHDYFGTSNERSVKAYLEGHIDDLEFIKRDVSLWKKNGKYIKIDSINDILTSIPLMEGAKECIAFLRDHHIKTAIVSAGLDILAERVAKELGIDYVFANGVKTDPEGRLTGEGVLQVQLMHKEKNVKHLADKLNIPLNHCIAVGNSCFDIPMFETCGTGIAFNPEDECVRTTADIIVEGKDLRNLIPVIKNCMK
ncbi:MAG: HAD-IB family phosphatase [Methanobacteriota archaeon]